jgi:hypothetical protein
MASAQCHAEQFIDRGMQILQSNHFTFLKSYPISGKEGKKYSYIFSTGAKYLITLSNSDAQVKGAYVILYDSNNKEVARSFKDGKFYSEIVFSCKITGIYHMKFSFDDAKEFCAGSVLGMKR